MQWRRIYETCWSHLWVPLLKIWGDETVFAQWKLKFPKRHVKDCRSWSSSMALSICKYSIHQDGPTSQRKVRSRASLQTFHMHKPCISQMRCWFIKPLTLYQLLSTTWVVQCWASALFLLTSNIRLRITVKPIEGHILDIATGLIGW